MSVPGRLDRYVLELEIEPGSLGRRFRSDLDGRVVVVEAVPIRCDDELFERALRRIELMSTIAHPHLVPVLDAGLDADHLFLVTPAPDRTADLVGPLGEAAFTVVRDVGAALAVLHQHGVLHRDLQARHVGWFDGVVRLGGVGLADLRGAGRTRGLGPIGGVLTMAPSLVRGAPASVGSDAYSLGALLHLLATGLAVHPVRSESLAARVARIGIDPPRIDPTLAPSLRPAVAAALAADGCDHLPLEHLVPELDVPPPDPAHHHPSTRSRQP